MFIEKTVRYLALTLPFLVLFLIFFGALVTSHDAGLTVPDWPNSYGDNMFLFPPSKWIGGIFYEHVHRLIASGIGFLTLLLAILTFCTKHKRWLKILTFCALIVVIMQGVLGGLTVLYMLPTAISVSHAVLAQSFLLITIAISYFHTSYFSNRFNTASSKFILIAILLIYIQLLLGAIMRHTASGLAVLDFPSVGGALIPYFNDQMFEAINTARLKLNMLKVDWFQINIHLLHRYFAFVLGSYLFVLGIKLYKSSKFKKLSLSISGLVIIQIILGILTILSLRSPYLTSIHVIFGALLLGLTFLLALRYICEDRN